MKKTILALVAVFAMTLSAQAQGERPEGPQGMRPERPNPQMMVQMLADSLGLTAEQKEALETLNKEYAEKMRPMRPEVDENEPKTLEKIEGAEDKAAQRVERQKARDEYKDAVKAILNEEQYNKFEELEKNMRHPKAPRHQMPPQGLRPEQGEAAGPTAPRFDDEETTTCEQKPECCKEGAECCKEGAECCEPKECPEKKEGCPEKKEEAPQE